MYFWKVDALVNDFKNNNVTQKEQFKYLLLFSVLIVLITAPYFQIDAQYNIFDSLDTISSLFITLWGLYYCYNVNSKGDDTDFIPRFICLGLPVVVRVACIFLPVVVLLGFIEGITGAGFVTQDNGIEIAETTALEYIVFMVFEVVYYIYLSKALRKVSQ